jgi:hypothetical protein
MALVTLGLAACTFPNAPTAVTAVAGNGQATVSWTAPTPNGTQITGYVVTPYVNNVAQPTQEFGPTATSGVMPRLANGTTYVFIVETLGLSGGFPASSNPSAASNPVTPTNPPGSPGQVTGVTATAGNSQATVSWTAPVIPTGAQTVGYFVTPYIGNTAQNFPTSLTGTSASVTGLTNGTTYTFTVTAGVDLPSSPCCTYVQTPESAPSNPIIPSGPPGVELAPTAVTASGGNAQATVSWTAPYNGSMITSYVIQPVVGGANLTPQTFSGAFSTVNVPGLTNGESYTFTVTAINAAGTGAASAPSNAVVVGAPGAPTAVTPIPPWGNGQATISWTAPPGNGAPITEYEITPFGGPLGSTQTPQDFFSSATTETVTGLQTGYGYGFTVRAANQFGFGPEASTTIEIGL